MGQLLEGYTGFRTETSAEGFDQLETMQSRAQLVQYLSGKERQVVMLAVTYMRAPHIARRLNMELKQVKSILTAIKKRFGVRYIHELIEIVRISQVMWEPTPAQALFLFTQHNLIGATIRGSIVQDSEWFGLLLDMPDGTTRTAWFLNGREGDCSNGWIELEEG
ncbi:helix-turn-helix transcriptional regulator [Pelagibacterium luteolum]|uniref:Uncharacterized protein n=1 Tax=Pelagibacterium luteolum TaxID=440168 RepID=A0A1G7UQS8_9HYPH|nr:hypothetical protein [Pelagibacterium luteolum]SDG49489.1 hypothetical protein SAMN04487974_103201 [Pelagibacterium luteolum]